MQSMNSTAAANWATVVLKDAILVAELSVMQQRKWSCDSQHSNFSLIGLDQLLDRYDPINLLELCTDWNLTILPNDVGVHKNPN